MWHIVDPRVADDFKDLLSGRLGQVVLQYNHSRGMDCLLGDLEKSASGKMKYPPDASTSLEEIAIRHLPWRSPLCKEESHSRSAVSQIPHHRKAKHLTSDSLGETADRAYP